jgi:tetratricopeptide (TPR) repeat protein
MLPPHHRDMNWDISPLLENWDYQPGKLQVRKIKAKDGSEKIQLRIDLGIMQMNAAGRPDGKRPFGHPTLLEHYQAQLERHPETFKLTGDDCAKLNQEAIQFHHRYISWFQLGDFENVIRDTERNIEVFEFASEHAPSPEMLQPLRVVMPQLLMLNTRARATLAVEADDHEKAIEMIENGMEAIATYFRSQDRVDLADNNAESLSLQEWANELREKRPLSQREKLEQELADAVQREDYENAARLRDQLRNLQQPS